MRRVPVLWLRTQGRHHRRAATSQLKSWETGTLSRTVEAMIHQMKKSELIHALKSLGETPPEQWTVPELRTRLMEAEEEKGIIRTKGRKMTVLQHWVCRLN